MTLIVYYVAVPLGLTTMDYLMGDTWGYVQMSLLSSLLYIALMYLCSALLNRLRLRQINRGMLALYIIIAASQVALTALLIVLINGSMSEALSALLVPFCLLLTLGADTAVVFGLRKQRQAMELQTRAQQAESALEIQGEYYEKLQKNILAVNQIRHDLNNQLQTAYQLIRQDAPEEAKRQLDTLSVNLHTQVGPRFSSNLVADAVISEKVKAAAENDIIVRVMAELPATLPISNAHLCSAFSNILDNAIAAVSSCSPAERVIDLDAGIRTGYLVIRCSNPASDAPTVEANKSDVLRRHGLGLDILREIANQHQGQFSTEKTSGQYTATLILMLPHSA